MQYNYQALKQFAKATRKNAGLLGLAIILSTSYQAQAHAPIAAKAFTNPYQPFQKAIRFTAAAIAQTNTAQALMLGISPDENNILYVDKNVIGGNERGNSWADALPELADALKWAREQSAERTSENVLKIYVAAGTYLPLYGVLEGALDTDNRDKAFVLSKNVHIYGGFKPSENITSLTQTRNFTTNATILSGDIGVPDNDVDNSYHVVIAAGNLENLLIDGVTVRDGNANGAPGAAIVINEKNTYRSAGAGIYNIGGTIVLQNATITNNTAYNSGAALYNDGEHTLLKVRNSIIKNNYAVGSFVCTKAHAEFVNCIFKDNTLGAAKDSGESTTKIYNSIIYDNGSSTSNCVNFEKVHLVKYSIVCCQNNESELDHVKNDPTNILYDTSLPSQHLTGTDATFIGINKGSNAAYADFATTTSPLATDFDGNARRYNNSTVDIGPFEYQGDAPETLPVTFISFTAKKSNNAAQLTWKTANESNNKGFEIYRSGDDKQFVKVAFVAAKQNYQWIDNKPLQGNNYYQLVQVDNDGTATTLASKLLNFDVKANNLYAYPNPAKDKIYLANTSVANYQLTDLTGKIVASGTASDLAKGLNIAHLNKGIYFIRLDGKSYKIIKE